MSTRFHHRSLPVLLTLAVLATAALCATLAAAASAAAAEPPLAMGNTVTMLIKPDGSLWAWGNSPYGQLGLGPSVYTRTRPSRVGTAGDWARVQVGTQHALALKTDGSLWAWGNNPDGRLGLNDLTSRWDPTRVGSDSDWAAIATGLRSSFALKTDGTLWAWGLGEYGRLGLGDTNNRLVPTPVGMDTDWALVDGGGWHTVALKSDGTLWAWGRNNLHQLGLPGVSDRLNPEQVGSDTDWATVRSGDDDVRAMKSDGSLWAWGYNSYGQLGLGDLVTRQEPTEVGGLWSLLACGDDSTYATHPDGTLWAWGDNTYGQLGQNDHDYRTLPTQVGSDVDWSAIVSGHDHAGALKPDGGLWVWGKNDVGQLGLGDKADRLLPVLAFYATDVTAPTIDSLTLTSPTHPDNTVWYANAFPAFAWPASADQSGPVLYSIDFDKSPVTIPSPVANATDPTWTAPQTADGTWYFHVRAGDAAGNWSSMVMRRVKIDATAPLTTDDAPAIGSKTPVTVHLTATDAFSGVAATDYALDGGSWTSGTQIAVTGEGLHTVAYRSTDNLGTVEADKSCTVRIDTTAPLTTDDAPTAWVKSPLTVHLTATDAGVGVAATEYKLDGGAWTSGTQVIVSGDGLHTVTYRSTDALGTVEADKSRTVRIDATAPLTTDDAPTAWGKSPVTVHLTATDAGSGVAATEYALDGGAWTSGTQVAVSGNGLHTVAYRSTDALGTVEADKSCTVRIDTMRPTTQAPKSARVRKGRTVALAYKVADPRPGSPTATVTIKIKTLSGKTVKRVTLSDRKVGTLLAYKFRCTLAKRTYRFFIYANDAAGNVQAKVGSNKLTVY